MFQPINELIDKINDENFNGYIHAKSSSYEEYIKPKHIKINENFNHLYEIEYSTRYSLHKDGTEVFLNSFVSCPLKVHVELINIIPQDFLIKCLNSFGKMDCLKNKTSNEKFNQ